MAFVYWIHLPEHTDLSSQGYVGVTSKTVKDRFRGHKAACSDQRTVNVILYNAMRKYKSQIVVETLVECTEDYAYWLEAQLRPSSRIGWNTAPGGEKSGVHSGYTLSAETKAKMSAYRKGRKLTKEHSENISKGLKGIKRGPLREEVVAQRERTRFYTNMLKYNQSWQMADKAYEIYLRGGSSRNAARELNQARLQGFDRMFDKFRSGWNPNDDEVWAAMFRGEEYATHT